jgi:hypothetical protein
MDLYGTPKVGGDCLAWCTRCKIELSHIIAAMVDGRPKRVVCKTCKSQHNFKRQGLSAPHKAGGRAKTTVPKTQVRASEYWEQKMNERKTDQVVPYNVRGTFNKGNVISHTLFGMGIVEEVRGAGKIVVLFRVGEKILVHGLETGTTS